MFDSLAPNLQILQNICNKLPRIFHQECYTFLASETIEVPVKSMVHNTHVQCAVKITSGDVHSFQGTRCLV